MANYSNLIQTINDSIKANGNQEITGPVLNSVLQAMVSALGEGYQFMGVATPATNPGTPDVKAFYIAIGYGTYTNFGNIVVYENEIAFLHTYTTENPWRKEALSVNQSTINVNDIGYADTLDDVIRLLKTPAVSDTYMANGLKQIIWTDSKKRVEEYICLSPNLNLLPGPSQWRTKKMQVYPFNSVNSLKPFMRAFKDAYINSSEFIRVGLFDLGILAGNSIQIRLCALNEDGTVNNSVGDNGIVAVYNNSEYYADSVRKIDFTTTYAPVVSASCVVDIDELKKYTEFRAGQNGTYEELSPLCIVTAAERMTSQNVYALTPRAYQKIWDSKTYFLNYEWLKDFVIDIALSGTKYKNIGIGGMSVTLGGRMFIYISKYDDADETISTTDQLCQIDIQNFSLPEEEGGHRIATYTLTRKGSYDNDGYITVDWAALPRIPDTTAQAYKYFSIYSATLSSLIFKDKIDFSGYSNIEIDINSVGARIITPDNYSKDNPSYFIIHCHGNGQNHNTLPSTTAQQWMRRNNIGFASIDIQDYVSEPFESDASGWGNYITYNRIIQLYNYLAENYAVKGIIMAGSSMGGLTMGEIAYRKPFSILFCLGLGAVPGVEIIWDNSPSRRPAIRNAYGMNPDGTDDSEISEFTSGYDWYKMGMTADNKKIGFTNMYLYYGDDNTFRTDFGGVAQYTELRDAILAAGTYCAIKQVGSTDTGHADASIWDDFISDNIFTKELGL